MCVWGGGGGGGGLGVGWGLFAWFVLASVSHFCCFFVRSLVLSQCAVITGTDRRDLMTMAVVYGGEQLI